MGLGGNALGVIFRLILIALNIVFVLLGLAFMSCGIVVKFFLGAILQSSLLSGLVKEAFDEINKDQSVPKNLQFGTFADNAGLALIILGVIIFGISVFACCGACYRWRPFLIIFCCLIIILVIGEIVATALLAAKSSPVHTTARKELVNQLKNFKPDGTDGFSATMNLLMIGMHCCGVNGQDDFKGLALKYKDQLVLVPPACCKVDSEQDLMQCQNDPNTQNSYQEGCYDKLLDVLNSGNKWAIPIVVTVIIVQIIEVLFAAYIVRDIGKDPVGPI